MITKFLFLLIFCVILCFSAESKLNLPKFTCNSQYDTICTFDDVHLNETHPHFIPIHKKKYKSSRDPTAVHLNGDQNNTFHTLTSDLCNKFPGLRDFKIIEVGLVTLEHDAFHNCRFLKDLEILGNNVEHLPQKLLEKNTRLKYFTLRRNKIKELPAGFFDTTNVLTILTLGEPLMEQFVKLSSDPSTGVIKPLTLMKQLNIEENSITDLDMFYVLRAFPNLQYFNICPFISRDEVLLLDKYRGWEVKQKRPYPSDAHLGTCFQGIYKKPENESGFDENIPTFNCSSESRSYTCKFENLNLNETHPHFRPRTEQHFDTYILGVSGTNSIHTLTSDFCKAFPHLNTHEVTEVGLQVIQEDAYKPCVYLETITLSGNQLTTLPSDVFKYNLLLDMLWIIGCLFQVIFANPLFEYEFYGEGFQRESDDLVFLSESDTNDDEDQFPIINLKKREVQVKNETLIKTEEKDDHDDELSVKPLDIEKGTLNHSLNVTHPNNGTEVRKRPVIEVESSNEKHQRKVTEDLKKKIAEIQAEPVILTQGV
uniref:CSON012565 protein n=1 Tax=Culicoides sonorensis TaxID=179676 RepID=A0A336LH61_CULSO